VNESIKKIADSDAVVKDLRPSLNVRKTARILGCCTKTVVKLCEAGELRFHWVGKKRMFRPEDLESFWHRKRIDPSSPTSIDSSHTTDERRRVVRQGSDADEVTLEEIRALCRR
jgi:excisionase family DNA binding protein